MKKILALLLVMLMTGCAITPYSGDLDKITNKTLVREHRPNYVTKGYKLYLPYATRVVSDKDNNLIIYNQGNHLYMYTDLISYYYKFQEDFLYDVKPDLYYSKKLDYQDKLGYIEIRKRGTEYLVQVMYNYAKIEAIVNKEEVEDTVETSLTILKTIIYKQKIIEALLNNRVLSENREEVLQLFKPKNNQSNFLKYEKTYGQYKGEIKVEEAKDEDQIEVETTNEDAIN